MNEPGSIGMYDYKNKKQFQDSGIKNLYSDLIVQSEGTSRVSGFFSDREDMVVWLQAASSFFLTFQQSETAVAKSKLFKFDMVQSQTEKLTVGHQGTSYVYTTCSYGLTRIDYTLLPLPESVAYFEPDYLVATDVEVA